jgi:hypothetical protein
MFFFEKKNQKTFAPGGWLTFIRGKVPHRQKDKSFLLLFFKKEGLPSFEAIHASY